MLYEAACSRIRAVTKLSLLCSPRIQTPQSSGSDMDIPVQVRECRIKRSHKGARSSGGGKAVSGQGGERRRKNDTTYDGPRAEPPLRERKARARGDDDTFTLSSYTVCTSLPEGDGRGRGGGWGRVHFVKPKRTREDVMTGAESTIARCPIARHW